MVTLMDIKQELVIKLRNSDIISTGNRGVTTQTDTGSFSADLTYTLSNSPLTVKNVRSVSIDSVLATFGTDYTVDYSTGIITFTTARTGSYEIVYDNGVNDSIFPDFPQAHLKVSQFPRIAVDIIGSTSNEFGIGAEITESSYIVTIICYATEQTSVENMISQVKQLLMDNKKSLYYSAFITPTSIGPLLISEFGSNKILQRNQDAEVRFSFDGI